MGAKKYVIEIRDEISSLRYEYVQVDASLNDALRPLPVTALDPTSTFTTVTYHAYT
jgi:hypothetical protein